MLTTDFEFNVLEKMCNGLLSAPYLGTVLHHIVHENSVFEIAWWTGARDHDKQHRSSKATVFAGPKDQQLVLYFGNSHSPNIVSNTFQGSKQFNYLTFHGSQV